jgi:RNA polymerase sigma-70 factor (ECF subfamily)
MSEPAAKVVAQPVSGGAHAVPPGEVLVRAFTELRDDLISTLWFMLGNREDALDIAQEAFLRCWRHREELPGVRNLRAWVFRIGLNAARDLRRSAWRRRVKSFMGDETMLIDENGAPPGQELEDTETLHRVRQAVMDLRPEEQAVFLLRQNGELTYEQIAEMYNRPIGTVKTQMRSALQKLRKALP